MSKIVAALAVPGALGGLGLLYDGTGTPAPGRVDPLATGYVVEMGVAFPEAAVRAALPAGLEPRPGFTGGIALYGGAEGWALSPMATGLVWIDLAPGPFGNEGRFMVQGFATGGAPSAPGEAVTLGEAHELTPDGRLEATAWPDRDSILDLAVQVDAAPCHGGLSAGGGLVVTKDAAGTFGVMHMPVILDRCTAEPLSVRLDAPPGHPLAALQPERVIWASLGTPLRWAMPEL